MARVRVGRRIVAHNTRVVWDVGVSRPRPTLTASGGNFQTELDVLELGRRVAVSADAENNCWGAADTLFWLTIEQHQTEKQVGRNPIRKVGRQKPRMMNGIVTVHHGQWIATCFICGEEQRFNQTRKQAKDALYRHRRDNHGNHGGL